MKPWPDKEAAGREREADDTRMRAGGMIGTGGNTMTWLVKTEAGTYSYDDLEREGRAVWDGVTNPQALQNLKAMKPGERVFVYHTGDEKRVVGTAEVVRAAYPDPKQKNDRLVVVDLKAVGRLANPVTLADLKSDAAFVDSPLVKQGRLSVVPLTAAQERVIESRGRR
jgi:predicted RNA-binding protein with PUA-like domain